MMRKWRYTEIGLAGCWLDCSSTMSLVPLQQSGMGQWYCGEASADLVSVSSIHWYISTVLFSLTKLPEAY